MFPLCTSRECPCVYIYIYTHLLFFFGGGGYLAQLGLQQQLPRKVYKPRILLGDPEGHNSKMGQILFRRAPFQTPNSVSCFLALTELRGENSVTRVSEFCSAYSVYAKANSPSFFYRKTHRVWRRSNPTIRAPSPQKP